MIELHTVTVQFEIKGRKVMYRSRPSTVIVIKIIIIITVNN